MGQPLRIKISGVQELVGRVAFWRTGFVHCVSADKIDEYILNYHNKNTNLLAKIKGSYLDGKSA